MRRYGIPVSWQKSKFVNKRQYGHWLPEQRTEAEERESHVVRSMGEVGTPECNVIAYVEEIEDVPLVTAAPDLYVSLKRCIWLIEYATNQYWISKLVPRKIKEKALFDCAKAKKVIEYIENGWNNVDISKIW